MREWSVFFPDVLPDVLGCPEPTVERHLARAARDFCTRTLAWRVDLDAITTIASTPGYDLPLPSQSEAFKIIGATLNGLDIGLEVANGTSAADRQRGNSGGSRVLTFDLKTITVMPTPAAGQTLIVTALLRPTITAQGVPDFLGDQHGQIIADGALSTLLTLNKADWANVGLAAIKKDAFDKGIGRVQKAAWKAYNATNPRGRAMFF